MTGIVLISAVITFLIILAILAFLWTLYLVVLVRPRARKPRDTRLICDYAHRGLHGDGVPENSLAAFAKAAESGYGIELDVQLSRDGEIMVFHDYTLVRMTGREGNLSDFTADELRTLTLGGTSERIPTLAEVLALVDGRVPLLVELKGESTDTALCEPLAKMLAKYGGPYCIESFNPMLLGKMAKLMPHVYRGLLYTNVVRDKKRVSALNLALTAMLTNVIARPNFIAYNYVDRHSFFVGVCTKFWSAPRFSWTVREREEYVRAKENGECAIFEGFTP